MKKGQHFMENQKERAMKRISCITNRPFAVPFAVPFAKIQTFKYMQTLIITFYEDCMTFSACKMLAKQQTCANAFVLLCGLVCRNQNFY